MKSPADPSPSPAHDPHAREGIRRLLATLLEGDPEVVLGLKQILANLRESAFGMFLFIAILPSFIPIPGVGGAVSGPLVMLIGFQLLIGLHRPWLPDFIGRRGPRRKTLERFATKISPWLQRLDKVLKPRLDALVDYRLAGIFSGLLLVLLGLLLSLPIPFTNYLFGGLLLLFALALLERDGMLMAVAWVAGIIAILVFGILSGNLAALAGGWVARLF